MAASQEVLDAINGTIVSNDMKAITADSLRNLLVMMAENSGNSGGTGDGALRVMIPIPEALESDGVFSREQMTGVPEFDEFIEEMFIHNAKVYEQILEKAENYESVMVVLDPSEFTAKYMNLMFESLFGVPNAIHSASVAEPVGTTAMFFGEEAAEELGMNSEIIFRGYSYTDGTSSLAPYDSVQLFADGTLKFSTTLVEPEESEE